MARRLAPILNLRDRLPLLARLTEGLTAIDARRTLPQWHAKTGLQIIADLDDASTQAATGDVVLMIDTFNNYFEPANAVAAWRVLRAAGLRVVVAGSRGTTSATDSRPLCCGRTYLSAGRLDEARAEAQRTLNSLSPFLDRGLPVVGLEPSCMLGMRDEFAALLNDDRVDLLAQSSFLLEEFLLKEKESGRIDLKLNAIHRTDRGADGSPTQTNPVNQVLLHGHCHQKAFDLLSDVEQVLGWIPGLSVKTIDSSCCGMAGAFGFEREHFDISMKMAEETLLPAVRGIDDRTLVVADGTSCRHQIDDGANVPALHVARVLELALANAG